MSSTFDVARALRHPRDEVGVALLRIAEDQWFDRKSVRIAPRDLATTFIAMANADGGTVAVGLHGDKVEGTMDDAKRLNALRQAPIDFCQPPVRVTVDVVACLRGIDEDELLLFDVQPSEIVHSNRRDEVYLRIGDEDRRLTFAQRQELMYDRGLGQYESRSIEASNLDDVDQGVVDAYAGALDAPDPTRLLRARGLATGDHLTVAGALLFAKYPQTFLPEAFIRVLRYRGTERGTGARQQLAADESVDGPIPRQLVEARKLVRQEQPVRRALARSGRFELIPLVPEDAWLEALVNAAVHRSYSLAGDHIRVEIFDDRIEVTSPGRFPGLVDPSNPLGAPRFARNPRIARVCADQQFGQELGEGIRRMFEEMRLAGLADPLYEQTVASVRLTLSGEPIDRELESRLPLETRAIVATLRDGGPLSTGEMAERLGLSRPTMGQRLRTLRDAGLIEWDGKSPRDPRASWSLPST